MKDFPRSQFLLVFREILKEVKLAGEIHLVLDCDFEKVGLTRHPAVSVSNKYFNPQIPSVLKDAQSVGMMTAYHNYLITNMVSA